MNINTVRAEVPETCHSRIAVVVLNWNGLADALECLASLVVSSYPSFEIIVVDNGSADDSSIVIPVRFPQVTYLPTGENLGWAGGNNIGIRYALDRDFSHIFLLNNDTVVAPDCLDRLMQCALTDAPVALIHPAIYYFDEPDVPQLDPTAGVSPAERPPVVVLDHAYGAALFISTLVFESIGLIDERFFVQLEETDMFYRAKVCGIPSVCAPRARLLHKESRSFGGRVTPVKTYYIVRNSLLILSKHHQLMGGYRQGLKKLLWTINRMVASARGKVPAWRIGDLIWLLSSNPTAIAIRGGIADFLKKSFGRIPAKRQARLQSN